MKSFWGILALACLSYAIPHDDQALAKRAATGIGCTWCLPGPWATDTQCAIFEYSAVASSMRNPPTSVQFDATSFCSEFLRPLVTATSIVNITGATTTSTSTSISLIMFTPTTTTTAASIGSSAQHQNSHRIPNPTPAPQINQAKGVAKRDFTVPEYLTDWYYYGRLDPGCSCLITSALPSLHFSVTETDTLYSVTVSTTVTETYTIYPKSMLVPEDR